MSILVCLLRWIRMQILAEWFQIIIAFHQDELCMTTTDDQSQRRERDRLDQIIPSYEMPIPMNDDSLNFSYSGLKSYIINLVHNETQRGNEINPYDLARSFQDVAVDELVRKTRLAIERYSVKKLLKR